jgi:hypothetical protein
MERVNVENERGYRMDVEKARADNGRSKRIFVLYHEPAMREGLLCSLDG